MLKEAPEVGEKMCKGTPENRFEGTCGDAYEGTLEGTCEDAYEGTLESTCGSAGAATLNMLIVAGSPAPTSAKLLHKLYDSADICIAADAGANPLFAANLVPQVFMGDADSITPHARAWLKSKDVPVQLYPTEKDDTDLHLAFEKARQLAVAQGKRAQVTLTCASGGRADHYLGVMGELARAADLFPVLHEDEFFCTILSKRGRKELKLNDMTGRTVSVLPLCGEAQVSETGLKWELDHAQLDALSDRGISNVVTSSQARVVCHAGVIAVFVQTA